MKENALFVRKCCLSNAKLLNEIVNGKSRCQARFVSTRGKPWDIMLWDFYASHGIVNPSSPWVTKPAQMLMQEADGSCARTA